MISSTVEDVKIINFSKYDDQRGTLIPIESEKDTPFSIARNFVVFDAPVGTVRGFHAHREAEQIFVSLIGTCTVILRDGKSVRKITIDSPEQAIYVPSMIWNEIIYQSENCLFFALTSMNYDINEYISDWEEFLNLKERKKIQ